MYLSRLTKPPSSPPPGWFKSCDRAFNFSFDKQQYRFHISFERATWSVNNEISSGFGEEWILTQFPSEIWFFTPNLRNSFPPPLCPSIRPFFRSRKHRLIYSRIINSKSVEMEMFRSVSREKFFNIYEEGRGQMNGRIFLLCIRDIVITKG